MDAPLDDPGPGRLTDSADLLRVEVSVPLGVETSFARFADVESWWPADSPLRAFPSEVTLWEPPEHIRVRWAPGSTIDVRFVEVDDDLTTVIVEHRHLDRHDADARTLIKGDTGWWQTLRAYAGHARGEGS